ncbi:MAG: hypothetical protein Q8R37_00965 [Nanoarchaeota archaeon]|nr:hypothetical protein [Nanoarchaeota archaeon]
MTKASADVWWVIIGAAIALVVLVVVIASFTRGTTPALKGLSDCHSKNGICASEGCPQGTTKTSVFTCGSQGETCCIGVPVECDPNGSCEEGKQCQFYRDAEKWYCPK